MKSYQPYVQTFVPTRQCMNDEVMLIENIPVEGTFPKGGLISLWTLNRPDKLNSLNSESHKALKEACNMAESNDLIRVIVICLLYTSPSPRDKRQSRMPSSA